MVIADLIPGHRLVYKKAALDKLASNLGQLRFMDVYGDISISVDIS